jgi:uncharacterized membrane protein
VEEGDLSRRRIIGHYAATLAGLILWLAAIVAAPYLRRQGSSWSPFLYSCFAPLCHQRPERSFRAFGYPLAVCARCTGIYVGALIGLAAYPFRRGFDALKLPRLSALAAVSAPLALDAAGHVLGLWDSPAVIRMATGLLWGSILPFYFMTGVGELLTARPRR